MTTPDPSLRLRFFASVLIFTSGYAPLLLILVVKDLCKAPGGLSFHHPTVSLGLLATAIFSSIVVLTAARGLTGGLPVRVTKASNKSGDMFGYTIPYMLSFIKLDVDDWQMIVSVAIFLAMMFAIAYRTQTVFVNPVLALRGYMLIDCTFNHGDSETQASVLTRFPLKINGEYKFERLSHYLYAATEVIAETPPRKDEHA
jgi:hypothetical protein